MSEILLSDEENNMKFQKKPVVIEAIQWTGANLGEIRVFMSPNYPRCPDWESEKKNVSLFIDTLEGTHEAKQGDWIIKGVKGEFYPCKPDIFAMTYEPAKLLSVDMGTVREEIIKLFKPYKQITETDLYIARATYTHYDIQEAGLPIVIDRILSLIQPLLAQAEQQAFLDCDSCWRENMKETLSEARQEGRQEVIEKIKAEFGLYWSLDVQEAVTYIKIPKKEYVRILKSLEG
ncbi:MAG: hypothetical protein WC639_04715 [Patescibacteria group bacterium]|jgi:hypothetical protein